MELMLAGSPEAYHLGTAVADHRDTEEAVTRLLDAYRLTTPARDAIDVLRTDMV